MPLNYGTVSRSRIYFFLYSLTQFIQFSYALVFRTSLQVMLIGVVQAEVTGALLNLLTPNVNYSGRAAPLTSKVAFYIFIQQI